MTLMAHNSTSQAAALLLIALTACAPRHVYTTDCGFDAFPAPGHESRVTWTNTPFPRRLDGQVRETGRKAPIIRKASVLLPKPGTWDTLAVRVDSTGAFHLDSLPPGRRKVIVQARWYWAAFDTVEVRTDSGLHADVRLEPTPQGWYGCIPH